MDSNAHPSGSDQAAASDPYAPLSLSARLAVALHCFEGVCAAIGLDDPAITEFLDYLWDFPTITGPTEFAAWEDRSPALVLVGMGDPFPPALEAALVNCELTATAFRELLENVVEIVWSNFWSAPQDASSLAHLHRVLRAASERGVAPPPADRFATSRFIDRHGWGHPLTREERDAWRRPLRKDPGA